jgi:Zn-dependent protease
VSSTFQIGSVLGIAIRVHVLAIAMLLVFAFSIGFDPALGLWIGVLGVVLLLHELAHSLAARRFGIEVIDITIWPLGGMARLSAMPESSRVEGLIALAGPAVNLGFAMLAWPLYLWIKDDAAVAVFARQLVFYFFVINVVMGVFNLIPAFPADGGRILRAVLGRNGDWVGATEKAVMVGRIVAAALFVFGVSYELWILSLVALWLWWMGWLELRAVRQRHAPRMHPAPAASSVHRSDGFSEEDIERLEKFRGRLRHFDPPS